MTLYHVNFHTLSNKPIFEDATYDGMIRECFRNVIRDHKLLCPAWDVMPTHVHMIIEDFPDLPRSAIIRYVKGGTAHAFLAAFPDLRADLLGGHLWTKGYFFVAIETHRQFLATLSYVRMNRARADLAPPTPLQPA